MGLLNKLFGNKSNEKTNMLAVQNHILTKSPTDGLFVHQDIEDLLWIADGPRKNFVSDMKQEVYEYEGIRIAFSGMQQDEPSLIYTKLPLTQVSDISKIERPPYYPTYVQLTPEQKSVYWNLLSNPYNPNIDIGFVFILYYGLERHLLNGDYERAFRVILKLRDVHKNGSFQSYSANALILTCLCRQRADLTFEFMQSLDKDYELQFSDSLFIFCKYSLDIPLTAKDIMRLAKSFEFSNTNYIKNYPKIFEELLLDNIQTKYHSDTVLIRQFITAADNRKIKKQAVPIYANLSIIDKNVDVPMLIENFKLKKALYDLLEVTHEQAKAKLAELRKNGELAPKENKSLKIIVPVVFDAQAEQTLLNEFEKHKKNFYNRHFALINLQDFYYKYRDLEIKYLEKCIEFCYEDINSLEQMQKAYYIDEVKRIKQFADIYRKQELDKQIADVNKFNGIITAFKRLAIIFEKQKEYEKAIQICEAAQQYYLSVNMTTTIYEFKERKEKILNKLQ